MMSVVPLGGSVALGGTTYAARPELGGVVVRDALIPVNLTDSGGHVVFQGALQDRVVKENVSGTLDFYQTLRSDAAMPNPALLEFVRRWSFAGSSTDVDYRTDGLGAPSVHPYLAQHPTPDLVSFVFGQNGYITPGEQTLFYFVKTNATSFDVDGKTELAFGDPAGAVTASDLITAEPVPPQHAQRPGAIVGTVFNDTNHDGIREAVEPGLAGWTVYLDANNNGKLDAGEATVVTNAAGAYTFTGVAPGNYLVREVVPPGWVLTAPKSGFGTATVTSGTAAAGPVFGDYRINSNPFGFRDLLALASHYGKAGAFADGDLNGDGVVNFQDLLLLAANYGKQPGGGPVLG